MLHQTPKTMCSKKNQDKFLFYHKIFSSYKWTMHEFFFLQNPPSLKNLQYIMEFLLPEITLISCNEVLMNQNSTNEWNFSFLQAPGPTPIVSGLSCLAAIIFLRCFRKLFVALVPVWFGFPKAWIWNIPTWIALPNLSRRMKHASAFFPKWAIFVALMSFTWSCPTFHVDG